MIILTRWFVAMGAGWENGAGDGDRTRNFQLGNQN